MDGVLLWEPGRFPVLRRNFSISACKSAILDLQRHAKAFIYVLLIFSAPANAEYDENFYAANFGFGVDGYGLTPEAACQDLIDKTAALEGGTGIFESIVTAPAGITDACGDSIVTGPACKFGTRNPGDFEYCTFYAFVGFIGPAPVAFTIRIQSDEGSSESDTRLTSVEPGKSKNMIARVFDDEDNLIPGIDIRIEADVIANSGGHQHHEKGRPKGSVGGSHPDAHIVTGNTGLDGYRFSYAAPTISGDHSITASCVAITCRQDGPKEVWAGIKGLVNLDSGPTMY